MWKLDPIEPLELFMPPFFELSIRIVWSVILGYWLWAARTVKGAQRKEPVLKRLFAYWLPLIVAALLLGPDPWFGHSLIRASFMPTSMLVAVGAVTLAILGACLAIYSRVLLGRNWSATVQLKESHELITGGPYRWIRHPIYTGFLLLFLGHALLIGEWRGLLAVAIVFASFWRKLRREESWLVEHFGESYRAYQSCTKALLPGLF